MDGQQASVLWYRDASAWRFIALSYMPWFAMLNLAWEALHVPLYTLWTEASMRYIAFSVLHCTLGDVMIGTAALLLALVAGREQGLARWNWRRIAVWTVVLGAGYTVFSEWLNLTVLRSWTYAESMPVIEVGELRLGLSPLLQWLVVPPVSLFLGSLRQGSGAGPAGRRRDPEAGRPLE